MQSMVINVMDADRLRKSLENEWKRKALISIDTYHPETAERALSLGASIINCVYEEPIADMMRICAKNNAELVVPCRLGGEFTGTVPKIMQNMNISWSAIAISA